MTDLNALMIFAKVVEAKSFSEAARRLAMPVSTVSRRVADLETELGTRLLVRSTRNVRLTEAGSEVIQHARKSAEVSDAVDRLMASERMDVAGLLRLSAPPSISDTLLSPLVASFRHAFPAIRVKVFISGRIADDMSEGVDLEVKIGPRRDTAFGRAEGLDLPSPARRQPRLPPRLASGRNATRPARPPSTRLCVSECREQLDVHRNRRAGQGDAAVPATPVDERLCGPDFADAGGCRHRRSPTRGATGPLARRTARRSPAKLDVARLRSLAGASGRAGDLPADAGVQGLRGPHGAGAVPRFAALNRRGGGYASARTSRGPMTARVMSLGVDPAQTRRRDRDVREREGRRELRFQRG